MKGFSVCAMLLLAGCSGGEVTKIERVLRVDVDTIAVPSMSVELPAETLPDSLTIATMKSDVASVMVYPNFPRESADEVKRAMARVKKWDVRVEVQPPPVVHEEKDTIENRHTVTRERSILEKIVDLIPAVLLIILVLGILFAVRGK